MSEATASSSRSYLGFSESRSQDDKSCYVTDNESGPESKSTVCKNENVDEGDGGDDEDDDDSDKDDDDGDIIDDEAGDPIKSRDSSDKENQNDGLGSDKDDEAQNKYRVSVSDVDDKIIKKEMSIYKVLNSKFEIQNPFEGDEKKLENKIQEVMELKLLRYHHLKHNHYPPYHICLFTYQCKSAIDRISKQTELHQTDCIVVFYRITDKEPEIFLLCSGNSYTQILGFADVDFRTSMIKHFLNASNIKGIEYYNLTGCEFKTTYTFRSNIDDFFTKFDFFEKVITTVSGEISKQSALERCIATKPEEAKNVRIDFGAFEVRILKKMKCVQWAKLFKKVSKTITGNTREEISPSQKYVVDAFDAVETIENSKTIIQLNEKLQKQLCDAVSNNTDANELYLSSKVPEEFTMASVIELRTKEILQNEFETRETWSSSPSLIHVIQSLQQCFGHRILTAIMERRIQIAFSSEGKRKEELPIQDMIHGSVEHEGVRFHKLNQDWVRLSSKYSDIIENRFAYFMKNAFFARKRDSPDPFCISDVLSNVLKYPWLRKKQQLFYLCELKEILKITETESKDLVYTLRNVDTVPLNQYGEFCLSKDQNMFLLPASRGTALPFVTELFKSMTGETSSKKEDKTASKGATNQSALLHLWDLSKGETDNTLDKNDFLKQKCTTPLELKNSTKSLYQVGTPILSKAAENELEKEIPKLKITDLFSCLRSLLPLDEGEYNELYLHPRFEGFEVIPGDRVKVKNVELFDILIHRANLKVTYLVHNKDGFKNTIRDACSQLRVSSQLFWMDYLKGKQTQAEGFWKAGTSNKAKTVYRKQLKQKLEALKREKFMSFFNDDITLVFMLGFRDKTNNDIEDNPEMKSTIAKMELLTLDAHFSKYQIGVRRKFQLKLFQFKSKVGPEVEPKKRKGDHEDDGPRSKKVMT